MGCAASYPDVLPLTLSSTRPPPTDSSPHLPGDPLRLVHMPTAKVVRRYALPPAIRNQATVHHRRRVFVPKPLCCVVLGEESKRIMGEYFNARPWTSTTTKKQRTLHHPTFCIYRFLSAEFTLERRLDLDHFFYVSLIMPHVSFCALGCRQNASLTLHV